MNEVHFLIRGQNESGRAFREADRDFQQFQRDTNGRLHDMRGRFVAEGEAAGRGFGHGVSDEGDRGMGRLFGSVMKLAGSLGGMLKPLATAGVGIAAIGSTAVSAAPLLAPVGVALLNIGQAAVAAAPALLAMGAAAAIVKVSFSAIFKEGSAARQALTPLADMFNKAAEAGSKAAAHGIKPLAQELAKVSQPIVTRYMETLGVAANRVQKDFLGWAKSADGVKSLKGILEPISAAMVRLGPHISHVAISFTQMLGRIMGVSVAAGSSGLARVLDLVADKLDKITAASVKGGMDKLADTFHSVMKVGRTLVEWVGKIVQAYRTYTGQFKLLADAVAVAAIIFGGPVTAVIAGVGLIIRHFDQLKAAYQKVKAAFSGQGGGGPLTGFLENLKSAYNEVLPHLKDAFEQVREKVVPVLQEIGRKIKDELIPALGEFIAAAAPVVSWMVDELAPVVAETWANVLQIISGAVDVITGIFEILTGILTGDWSKVWDGIVHITKGWGKIQGALIHQILNLIKGVFHGIIGIFTAIMHQAVDNATSAARGLGKGISAAVRGGWGAISSAVSWIKNKIVSFFSGAASWLRSAGSRLVSGLASAVRGAAGTAGSAASAIKNKVVGVFNGAGSWLKNAGQWLVSGLASGIRSVSGWVSSALRSVIPDFLEHYIPGLASGGISHAAEGGPRGNLTLVGERGPELVRLPFGSTVYPHGQSMNMLAAAGGGQTSRVVLELKSGGSRLDDLLVEVLRGAIRNRGGNVQIVLGR